MDAKPYIVYPEMAEVIGEKLGQLLPKCFVNEPGQVSYGIVDFVPGRSLALHTHHTWELILVDRSSKAPGFTRFAGHWWRVGGQ